MVTATLLPGEIFAFPMMTSAFKMMICVLHMMNSVLK